jgi:hypothetical protein
MSLSNNTTVQFSLSLDGLTQIDSDSINVSGVAVNPGQYVPYSGANASINLNGKDLSNVNTLTATGLTTLSHVQSSFSPATGNDLINLTYIQSQLASYITTSGQTLISGKSFKLSPYYDQFIIYTNAGLPMLTMSNTISQFNVNNAPFYATGSSTYLLIQDSTTQFNVTSTHPFNIVGTTGILINCDDGGVTTISRVQSSYAPSSGADLTNKTYVDGLLTGYVPYIGATQTVSLNNQSIINVNNLTINGVASLYRGQSSYTPTTGIDLTNKTYVDGLITNFITKTGTTTGCNLILQLLNTSSLFQLNSSVGGQIFSINNSGAIGAQSIYVAGAIQQASYSAYGISYFNSTGILTASNYVQSNNAVVGGVLTTIPTAISGQQQTLQWILQPSSGGSGSATNGWYLTSAYIGKFLTTDINITIPNLYCATLNGTSVSSGFVTQGSNTYNNTIQLLMSGTNQFNITSSSASLTVGNNLISTSGPVYMSGNSIYSIQYLDANSKMSGDTGLVYRNGRLGVGMVNPIGKFHVYQGSTGSPDSLTDWTSNYSIISNGTGTRDCGLGIAFDTAGNNASVWYLNIAPSVRWSNVVFGCNNYYFHSYGGGNVFNIGHLGTGALYTNGGTLTNTNPSDATLKCNINPMTDNLSLITQLDPVSYHWKDEKVHGSKLNYGFLAQDIQEVIPNIVSEFKQPIKDAPQIPNPETGMLEDQQETKLGYDPVSLIPFIVGSIKEQQSILNNQSEKLQEQKDKIDNYEKQINHLLSTQEILLKQLADLTQAVNAITSRM